jgi:hypothetical protein
VIEAFRSRELQRWEGRQIKRRCCTQKSSRAFTFQLFTPLNIIPTTLQKCNDVSKGIDFDRGYHQTVVDVFLKLHTHAVGVYHSSRGDWQSPVVI